MGGIVLRQDDFRVSFPLKIPNNSLLQLLAHGEWRMAPVGRVRGEKRTLLYNIILLYYYNVIIIM
jgi:hypothetical protein